jgi:hypothetical protein
MQKKKRPRQCPSGPKSVTNTECPYGTISWLYLETASSQDGDIPAAMHDDKNMIWNPILECRRNKTCWNLLQNVGSYPKKIVPCHYTLLGLCWPLKDALWGHNFSSNGKVTKVVHEWLQHQPQNYFSQWIQALMQHWRKCVKCNRDNTEDWHGQSPCCL